MDASLHALSERLRHASRITVLTGAGISAASGVPTFRGEQGLWRTHRAEDLATPRAFRADPRLVWEWYDWRRTLIAKCRPNAAHEALARLSERDGFTLITQNVDGLHEQAGTRNVLRLHGSIWRLQCADGCGARPWEDRTIPLQPLPPRCPGCGGYARPAVVWFGENLDAVVFQRCIAALDCDVFLSVGTSSVVYPAAGLIQEARARGAFTAEINPVTTAHGAHVDLAIAMPAEDVLPRLVG